jgi:hypothetical protein
LDVGGVGGSRVGSVNGWVHVDGQGTSWSRKKKKKKRGIKCRELMGFGIEKQGF